MIYGSKVWVSRGAINDYVGMLLLYLDGHAWNLMTEYVKEIQQDIWMILSGH